MRIIDQSGEVHIMLSVEESRKLIVDSGAEELVVPLEEMRDERGGQIDTLDCLRMISIARVEVS